MTLHDPEIANTPLRTKYGEFTLHVFSWLQNEQDNILALTKCELKSLPLIRIQSACYTGEIFESLDCGCHWQLETSLSMIQSSGGIFIYMLRDGRGAGLLAKIRGMKLSYNYGIDTAAAYEHLGVTVDPREYNQAIYIPRYFSITNLHLLTNSTRKLRALQENRFNVERVQLESIPTPENQEYLKAKANKFVHWMTTFGTGT